VWGEQEEAMSNENKALVRRWFEEVWNKGRASAIDEMLAGDAVVHGLGEDMNPSEFKAFHRDYRNAFPDISLHVDDVVAEGDFVAARWSGSATHSGVGLGVPPTGKPVRLTGMVLIRVEQGKVAEGWNNFDQFGMFQQLGLNTMASVDNLAR
jgi:steroid delta-isomerase-like uncharacterized protein